MLVDCSLRVWEPTNQPHTSIKQNLKALFSSTVLFGAELWADVEHHGKVRSALN
jgi:hypothetical protein